MNNVTILRAPPITSESPAPTPHRSYDRADTLFLHRMSDDGKALLDDGKIIYHNLDEQPVIEGPKMLKKDGWYYILAPAGGVQTGWQAHLHSSIFKSM